MNSSFKNKSEVDRPLFERDGALWCFAAKGISRYLDELLALRPWMGVINFEEENVHRIRVLCRKIRTNLDTYQILIPGADYQRFNQTFRKLSKCFAEVRELDVLSAELEMLLRLNQPGLNRESVAAIQKLVQEERAQAILKVYPKVIKIFEKNQLREIEALFEPPRNIKLESVRLDSAARTYLLMTIQNKIVQVGLFRADGDKAGFHQLRIVLKHLRYSFEEVSTLHEALFKALIHNLIPLQDAMGRVHDLEGWGERITALGSSGNDDEKDSLSVMSNMLKQYWQAEEKSRYQQFLFRWKMLRDSGFWEVMEKSLTAVF